LETKHALAWEILGGEASARIATERGLGDPQEAAECLVCHTTGYGGEHAPTFKVEQGVGCESCHGPGADYNKYPIMSDRKKAVENGLLEIDEETCLRCHNERSPTHPGFDFEGMWPQILHPYPTG
jgi:hypothetical protein